MNNEQMDILSTAVITAVPEQLEINGTGATHTQNGTSTTDGNSKSGGILRFPVEQYLIPDPAHADESESFMLIGEIYSGLTRYIDNAERTNVELDLAKTIEYSPERARYEITLKPDLKFSDGSVLVASDVKWSWERALKLGGNNSRAASVLGVIDGAEKTITGDSDELKGVVVVDDRKLIVQLAEPRGDLMMRLADPIAVVTQRANVEQWGADFAKVTGTFNLEDEPWRFDVLPVGTGPFKISTFDFWERICELTRNDHYAHQLATLDGVTFVSGIEDITTESSREGVLELDVIETNRNQIMALEEGTIHAFVSFIDPSYRIDPVGFFGGDGQGLWRIEEHTPRPTIRFLAFNDNVTPFDDIRFRRALISGFDTAIFNQLSYDPIPYRLIPSGFSNDSDDTEGLKWDIEKAAELLQNSDYPEVNAIELTYNRTFEFEPLELEPVFTYWGSFLGITVDLDGITDSRYREALKEGEIGMVYVQETPLFPDYSSVYARLQGIFGKEFASESYLMIEGWIHEAEHEPDIAKRRAIYNKIETLIREQALAVPVHWDVNQTFTVLHAALMDYRVPRFHGSRFAEAWFDKSNLHYAGD